MVTTILVTRHGYRSNWVTGVPQPPKPTGIEGDPVLAKHGEDQAEQLGAFLSTFEPRIQRIYSSPFYRCLQTAQPAAKQLALEINCEPGLGEWYKPERETKPRPASASKLKTFFSEVAEDYEPLVNVSPAGETIDELHERAIYAVKRIVEELEHEPEVKTILIVTHAATKIALGRALIGDREFDIRTGTCSVDRFDLKPDARGLPGDWDIKLNGETSFLVGGEEMHWSFDINYEPGSTEDIKAREQSKGDDDQVSIYIPLDMELSAQPFNSLQMSVVQIVDFDSDKPLFKVGDAAYEGRLEQMVGTEVYTDTEGNYFATGRQRIKAYPVNIEDENTESATYERHKMLNEKIEAITARRKTEEQSDENGEPADTAEPMDTAA